VRHAKAARHRRRRFAGAGVIGLIVLLAAGVFAALAVADHSSSDQIADGVTIGGIDVGGLTKDQALARLDQRIGAPSRRPVEVKLGSRTRTLSAQRAGVAVDLRGAVDRALADGRKGSFVSRGWRHLTGGKIDKNEPAKVTANKRAVHSFVTTLATSVAKPAVNAELSLDVKSVAVTAGQNGRRLAGQKALERRMLRGFTVAGAPRSLKAKAAAVPPAVTTADVWRANPVVVTVSKSDHEVRVFKEGKVTTTYRVAVGDPKFPTPEGRFTVQTKQKNPTWNVPDSEWAGDLAGRVIPGGDPGNPLVARWIGFDGSVGFHGTKDIASLGSSASHGCVRMDPKDVIDLFDRVQTGQTVLVGA
jgi:lipoprotein-anchoring transpeptidase ErfK/SrfK